MHRITAPGSGPAVGAVVRLTADQREALLELLIALHARDAREAVLPTAARGPARGIVDAVVHAVDGGAPLPDLTQLPPNAAYAASACHVLAGHPRTAVQLDAWLARNRAAAATVQVAAHLPIAGCVTHEDVRNRLLVDIDELPAAALDDLDAALHRAASADPSAEPGAGLSVEGVDG